MQDYNRNRKTHEIQAMPAAIGPFAGKKFREPRHVALSSASSPSHTRLLPEVFWDVFRCKKGRSYRNRLKKISRLFRVLRLFFLRYCEMGRTRLAHAVNHPRNLDLQMHTAPKALEIKSFSCTRGQKDPSQRGAFVPNKDENANYKKSLFLH